MRKRSTSSRRVRLGVDTDMLVHLLNVLGTDANLELPDRWWLRELLTAIMGDVDVRERFHSTDRGAPPDQDRKFWCAVWIANRPQGTTVTAAKANAVKHWKLTTDQVRIAWRHHSEQATELVASTRARYQENPTADAGAVIAKLVELHRSRGNIPA